MLTVKQIIAALSQAPQDALVYAYEGELFGLVIVSPDADSHGSHKELGYICAYPDDGIANDGKFHKNDE